MGKFTHAFELRHNHHRSGKIILSRYLCTLHVPGHSGRTGPSAPRTADGQAHPHSAQVMWLFFTQTSLFYLRFQIWQFWPEFFSAWQSTNLASMYLCAHLHVPVHSGRTDPSALCTASSRDPFTQTSPTGSITVFLLQIISNRFLPECLSAGHVSSWWAKRKREHI